MNPTVAVIIPCGLSHARFVGEAVASAQEADPPPDQIIVVDDFSHPQVMPHLMNGAKYVRFHEYMGRSHARNVGVDRTSSEWLYFLDADDWLLPTAIGDFRIIVAAKPTVQIVWANYEWSRSRQEPLYVCNQKPFDRRIMRRRNLAHIGLFVRRDRFHEVGGFDESMTIGEDRDFFSRYIINPKVEWHKHTRPFLRTRKGGHALPRAGELYGEAMKKIDALFAGGYYEKWRDA